MRFLLPRNQIGKKGIQLKGKNGILGEKGFCGLAKNKKRKWKMFTYLDSF
jgi:hypothetical protein